MHGRKFQKILIYGMRDAEYDLMHDLCFPSKQQISILMKEGYKGYLFNYTDDCYSILIFNGKDLIAE